MSYITISNNQKFTTMKTKVKNDNVFLMHQIAIAKKTINMPDAILNVIGGMIKKEAKKILDNNNIKY